MGLARTPPKMQFGNKLEDIQEVDGVDEGGVVAGAVNDIAADAIAADAIAADPITVEPIAHDSAQSDTISHLNRQIAMLSTRNRELHQSKQQLQIRVEDMLTQHDQERVAMVAHVTRQREAHKSTLSKWKEELAIQTANREEMERRYLASEDDLDKAYEQIDGLIERVTQAENALNNAHSTHARAIEKHTSEYNALADKRKHDKEKERENERRSLRYEAKIDTLNADIASLKREADAAREDQVELEQADETISELRRSLDKAQKEMRELKASKSTKSSKVERALERKLDASESELDALRSELKSVERSVEKRVKKEMAELSETSEGEVKTLQKQLSKHKEKTTIILADLKESERNRTRVEKELLHLQDGAQLAEMHSERADKAERRVKKLENALDEMKRASKKPRRASSSGDENDHNGHSKPVPKLRKRKAESENEDDDAPKPQRSAKNVEKKTKKKINIFGNGPAQPQKGSDGGVFGIPDVLSPVKGKSSGGRSVGGVGRGPFG
ncbi:hypothetical protein E3P89_03761 [Wallemia ichthyophaga]|uniref:Uncharacterized protein n=2 Tax=Wallemia ichthyophaga TaxID=245174 RepID=A0A4T0GXW8_WALIC|nr:uncharacterized protein J056_003498 [Wallemia ichthyophaga EXF-994]TIB00102.1 hypothetical protein E3P96_02742 [Wallemia ichthyophaga]EOR02936.1 hypothetical protein J056_003498 [Wallemia ichthyophaga EXF-994]TIB07618.1 hypothetical protein E3P93_03777 [Wallemia ichthyophaga]TIB08137.1 hypothetical protein E3P90_03787 [Wallemia ichthyophaga]TIB19660.1 hypothetical protein E3P89_03761 [Wallemia ichthyophaga]